MNKADTCRMYVMPKFKSAGQEDECITEQMVLTPIQNRAHWQKAYLQQGVATKLDVDAVPYGHKSRVATIGRGSAKVNALHLPR
jgi:hypothetical protein